MIDDYATYNWKPDIEISEDENWMDLVLILTRASQLKQGSMACIIVRPAHQNDASEDCLSFYTSRIVSMATNQSLYSRASSDVHAEIAAIGKAARRIQTQTTLSTEGSTAYITMPPCKHCFGALAVAGIKRIVSRYECKQEKLILAAVNHDIELVVLAETSEQRERVQSYINKQHMNDREG
jgi:tRNA(Arg) A34 adenosine deaminase TadA